MPVFSATHYNPPFATLNSTALTSGEPPPQSVIFVHFYFFHFYFSPVVCNLLLPQYGRQEELMRVVSSSPAALYTSTCGQTVAVTKSCYFAFSDVSTLSPCVYSCLCSTNAASYSFWAPFQRPVSETVAKISQSSSSGTRFRSSGWFQGWVWTVLCCWAYVGSVTTWSSPSLSQFHIAPLRWPFPQYILSLLCISVQAKP